MSIEYESPENNFGEGSPNGRYSRQGLSQDLDGQDSQQALMGTTDLTYTVNEVMDTLNEIVREIFVNEIWIKGTIHNYSESPAGHTYFSLGEKAENPKHMLSVALFKGSRNSIFREMTPNIQLENGLEVRIRGKMGIYEPRSQIQLIMSQLDTNYTMSKMAESRELLLAQLKSEGLLELNGKLELNPVPLKVALITSRGSAAHQDFEDELKSSGWSWEINLIHASVQGAESPAEICSALATAEKLEVDVVAMVRGGGSKMDLVAFDNEAVARAVTQMSKPVFCGIGHEIDISVVDLVAHTSKKTPTACAQALIEKVAETNAYSQKLFEGLLVEVDHILKSQRSELTRISALIADAPKESIGRAKNVLAVNKTDLRTSIHHIFRYRYEELETALEQLLETPQERFKNMKRQLKSIGTQIQDLSPEKFLQKGWSITRTSEGRLVRSKKDAPQNTQLITQIAEGTIESQVT